MTDLEKQNNFVEYLFEKLDIPDMFNKAINTSIKKNQNLKIDKTTNYYKTNDTWVNSEIYLYGEIIDVEGKDKANIHINTQELGVLTVNTNKQFLSDLKENPLYKKYGLRVSVKQNISNSDIDRNTLQLIELFEYKQVFDKEYLNKLKKKASKWMSEYEPDELLKVLRGTT